jgi:Spore coat polysaccharide biosynthesis protein F, CMP-KDO synthetase homolog
MVERVQRARLAGNIVVATSTDTSDNIIQSLCNSYNIKCFRGDINDLLDRHYNVALQYGADAVVKIPSDCPLIDPDIIDKVIGYYIDNQHSFDYVSNLHPATYPDGNDVEVMSFQTIEAAWKEASRELEREHTTPYIWENPDKFRIGNVSWETGQDFSMLYRWTIDYEEDYQLIKDVYEKLYPRNPSFGINDILQLLKEQPDLQLINRKYAGNYWYLNHLNDLNNISEYKNKLNAE